MAILSREEFENKNYAIKTSLIKGNLIFIYPTDTIYGIGCNALNEKAVARIREIKKRKKAPFSVIAPSKKWIRENCFVDKNVKKWIKKLPGPYTLIFKIKKKCVAKNVSGSDTLGVRIPRHWFSRFVKEIEIPIVTTSVNKSGNDFMTSIRDLDKEIKTKVDFIVYEGIKKGNPSKIVDLTDKPKVIVR